MLSIGDTGLSEVMQFPATQHELFDKLQLRLVVFKDKIEVKAVFPMPDIPNQECTYTRCIGEGDNISVIPLHSNSHPYRGEIIYTILYNNAS